MKAQDQGDKKLNSSNKLQEVSKAASYLAGHACTISARHIKDGTLRIKFNREVAYYAREIVRDVEQGRKSAEDGLKALKEEQSSLSKQSLTIAQQSIGLVAGGLQITGGAAMCWGTLGLGCGLGAMMAAHGANNVYENGRNLWEGRSDTQGYVRRTYQGISRFFGGSEFEGNLAYGGADLLMSGYGAVRLVLKKDSWRLFKYINADYIRAYEATSRRAFLFDRVSDGVTIKSMAEEWGNKSE
ncbi:DUF4225 domain-containing protein [Pseudomonas cichorii]|nr:DUF4225 domain-containing protein [Pseudomonas cichorii]MBX8490252.1 DUF4225 domain-containing protein [Pseudomonas cichorii]MBX8535748.1 DUF4225 domain-containing protein [Pseudomonas cichorii]MBX8546946.1 DUF4225 domain-containing protein [Pseudomonas cichorii]MBX8571855.1 DUF4225 domain-containing protein [Pseudomonas cichorii]MBX8604488.1 DUF4225 domain-containing protein [Pseudomonas cichorii]